MDLEAKAQAALEAKQAEEGSKDGTQDNKDAKGDDNAQGAKKDGADAGGRDNSADGGGDGKPKSSDSNKPTDTRDTGDAAASDDDNNDAPQFDADALPERARYIYDNLPALRARGSLGDGKVKDFTIKTAQELPEKFEFASKRDELLFVQELADQAQRANSLDTTWQQQDQKAKFETWQAQQAKDISADLADLQKEELVPKFTEKEAKDNPDHPGVKLANDVYDYMQKTNTARANAGKPYFLSFRDAAEIVLAKKGLETKSQSNSKVQQERTKIAAKVGGNSGTSRELKKPQRFKSVWDIVDLHDSELN